MEIFKESLLALNQVANFLSPGLIFSKRFSILEYEINKFALSGIIIEVSLLELVKRSFKYMRNKSGRRMEPCREPQVVLGYMLCQLYQAIQVVFDVLNNVQTSSEIYL